jgi:amino acid permease
MEKIFLEYTENIEFLKLLTFFIVSFSFTFLGALFTIIRTINKKKGRQKKIRLVRRLSIFVEVLLSCAFIAIFVVLLVEKLKGDYVRVIALSIVLGIAREHIANKVSEEDFWQKVIKYIFSNAADKYKLLKDFFKK